MSPHSKRKCRRCKIAKGPTAFSAGKRLYRGKPAANAWVCTKCKSQERTQRQRNEEQWRKHGRPCFLCGVTKPYPDDVGVANNATCRECKLMRRREAARRWRQQNPDKSREGVRRWRAGHRREAADASRRWRQRVKSDPDRYQIYLENRRIDDALRRRRNGAEPNRSQIRVNGTANGSTTNGHYYPRGKGRVPANVLVPYIVDWIGQSEPGIASAGQGDLADLAGVSSRRIYSILHGEYENVTRDTADAICAAISVPFALVYPEYR